MASAAARYRWRKRTHPEDVARREAAALAGRPDWWLAARHVKRDMRRARTRSGPSRAQFWAEARTEFTRLTRHQPA